MRLRGRCLITSSFFLILIPWSEISVIKGGLMLTEFVEVTLLIT